VPELEVFVEAAKSNQDVTTTTKVMTNRADRTTTNLGVLRKILQLTASGDEQSEGEAK